MVILRRYQLPLMKIKNKIVFFRFIRIALVRLILKIESSKLINLHYQNNDFKKSKQSQNGTTNISNGQQNSIFMNYHTQRDPSASPVEQIAKKKINNWKIKEAKTRSRTKIADNSSLMTGMNYKELIKAKDQEIEQLKNELNKTKNQLNESQKKLALNTPAKGQTSFDIESNNDKTYMFSRTTDSQEHYVGFSPPSFIPNTQSSIDHLHSMTEKIIEKENSIRNVASVNSTGIFNTCSSAEVKTALSQLKKRTQRLIEKKINPTNSNT